MVAPEDVDEAAAAVAVAEIAARAETASSVATAARAASVVTVASVGSSVATGRPVTAARRAGSVASVPRVAMTAADPAEVAAARVVAAVELPVAAAEAARSSAWTRRLSQPWDKPEEVNCKYDCHIITQIQ